MADLNDEEMEAFITDCANGKLESIQAKIKRVGDINRMPKGDFPALVEAARNGKPQIVDFLLKVPGINVNIIGASGRTPLSAAVILNEPVCAQKLIDAKATLNWRNEKGWSLLHGVVYTDKCNYGTEYKRITMAGILLRAAANQFFGNQDLENCTPYEAAVKQGQRLMASLLSFGTDLIEKKDSEDADMRDYQAVSEQRDRLLLQVGGIDMLKRQIQELQQALRTGSQMNQELKASQKEMMKWNTETMQQIEAAYKERDEIRRWSEGFTQERDELTKERDELRKERDELRKEVAKVNQELVNALDAVNKKIEEKKAFLEIKEEDLQITTTDKLGEGVCGKVYKARYNGADIAVKVLDGSVVDKDFLHEVSIFHRLPPHPNVVGFLGASTLCKPRMLSMVLMKQGSVEKLLLVEQQYPLEFGRPEKPRTAIAQAEHEAALLQHLRVVVWFLIGASAGVVQLHANRVIHCDLASRNLLVDQNNNCVVADFGMSQIIPEGQTSVTIHFEKMPIAWMAPELLDRLISSEKSDVYAFGITLWEVLARNAPYRDMHLVNEVAPQVIDHKKRLRPTVKGEWPDQLVELMTDCLQHAACDRPTMKNVNERLRRYHTKLSKAKSLADVYVPHNDEDLSVGTEPAKKVPPEPSHYYISSAKF